MSATTIGWGLIFLGLLCWLMSLMVDAAVKDAVKAMKDTVKDDGADYDNDDWLYPK